MTTLLSAPAADTLSDLVEFGRSLAGTPFANHGRLHTAYRNALDHEHIDVNPGTGFDCTGFIGYVFGMTVGVRLPRHVVEIFCATTKGYIGEIALAEVGMNPDKFQKGDILLFSRRSFWLPTHAAIYCGEGTIVHSAQRLGGVAVTNLDEMLPRLIAARRVDVYA